MTKKQIILVVVIALCISLLLFFGMGGGDESFVAVLMIAGSILSIILFFLIWRMTNDVNVIKKTFSPVSNSDGLLRKYYLLGQNDKAADLLIDDFISTMEKYISSVDYRPTYNIKEAIKVLEHQLQIFGAELPEKFKNLTTASDYKDLLSLDRKSEGAK